MSQTEQTALEMLENAAVELEAWYGPTIAREKLQPIIAKLREEQADEQKTYERIASVCSEVGIDTPDGTCIGSVRKLADAYTGMCADAENLQGQLEQAAPAVSPDVPQPSRRQIVFDWLMDDKGYWGTSKEVARVDELLYALDKTAAPVEASPSAGAQEGEHVVSHYEPWGVMPTKKRAAASPSAGAQPTEQLYQDCYDWLVSHGRSPSTQDNCDRSQNIANCLAHFVAARAAASPDVLARIDGLIAKWRSGEGWTPRQCADDLDQIREIIKKEAP